MNTFRVTVILLVDNLNMLFGVWNIFRVTVEELEVVWIIISSLGFVSHSRLLFA